MKNLVIVLYFTMCICVASGIGYLIADRYQQKPAYTIQQTSEILNRWQVTQADSVCYTGSIADCQAWIETEKYRNH
jgi:hypothetical protein